MLGTIKSEYLGCGFYNYLCDWSIKRDAPDIRTDNPAFSDIRRAERYIFFEKHFVVGEKNSTIGPVIWYLPELGNSNNRFSV